MLHRPLSSVLGSLIALSVDFSPHPFSPLISLPSSAPTAPASVFSLFLLERIGLQMRSRSDSQSFRPTSSLHLR